MGPRVYVIEDDPVFSTMVSAFLMRNDQFRVRTFSDPEEALEATAAETTGPEPTALGAGR